MVSNSPGYITIQKAAMITGIALLCSVLTAPFAEMYAIPKLVVPYKTAETAANIIAHKSLFIAALFAYLINFIADLVITWGLYLLLRPVNVDLSLLAGLFRLVYTILGLVALNNLVTAFRLLDTPDYLSIFDEKQLHEQVMLSLRAFKNYWYFGLIFFGIHLIFIGYLVFVSKYIPRLLGILLMITGSGYLLTTVRPYLFKDVNVDFAQYTFYGELIFMFWLLIKGRKIKAGYKI